MADQITTQEPLHDACNIKQNLVSQQQFCCFCIVGCGIERFKSEWLRNNPNSISHVLGAPWLIIFVKKTPLLGSEACVFLVRVSHGHVPSQSLGVGPRHQWFRNSSGDFQDSQGWQAVPIQASCTLHHQEIIKDCVSWLPLPEVPSWYGMYSGHQTFKILLEWFECAATFLKTQPPSAWALSTITPATSLCSWI